MRILKSSAFWIFFNFLYSSSCNNSEVATFYCQRMCCNLWGYCCTLKSRRFFFNVVLVSILLPQSPQIILGFSCLACNYNNLPVIFKLILLQVLYVLETPEIVITKDTYLGIICIMYSSLLISIRISLGIMDYLHT